MYPAEPGTFSRDTGEADARLGDTSASPSLGTTTPSLNTLQNKKLVHLSDKSCEGSTSSESCTNFGNTAAKTISRARKKSEHQRTLTLQRDQARTEHEGRREATRIIRSIKAAEGDRLMQSAAAESRAFSHNVSGDTSVGEDQLHWTYDAEQKAWFRSDLAYPVTTVESGIRAIDENATMANYPNVHSGEMGSRFQAQGDPGRPIPTLFAERTAHTRAKPSGSTHFMSSQSSHVLNEATSSRYNDNQNHSHLADFEGFPASVSAATALQVPPPQISHNHCYKTGPDMIPLPRNRLMRILEERSSDHYQTSSLDLGSAFPYVKPGPLYASALLPPSIYYSSGEPIPSNSQDIKGALMNMTAINEHLRFLLTQAEQVTVNRMMAFQNGNAHKFDQGQLLVDPALIQSSADFGHIASNPSRNEMNLLYTRQQHPLSQVAAQLVPISQRISRDAKVSYLTHINHPVTLMSEKVICPEDDSAVIQASLHRSKFPPQPVKADSGIATKHSEPLSRGVWPRSKLKARSTTESELIPATASQDANKLKNLRHPLPPRPTYLFASSRLLGIIPREQNSVPASRNTTDYHNDKGSALTSSSNSVVTDAGRTVRSNAPSPEELHDPIKVVNKNSEATPVNSALLHSRLSKAKLGSKSASSSSQKQTSRPLRPIAINTKPHKHPQFVSTGKVANKKQLLVDPPKAVASESTNSVSRRFSLDNHQKSQAGENKHIRQRKWTAFVQEMGGVASGK